jgi:hypothetical protein
MTRIQLINADLFGFIRDDPLHPRHPRSIDTSFAIGANALIICR